MSKQNAKKALKQLKMEVAADYGMTYDDAFEIIEHAHANEVLANHLKKLEEHKTYFSNKLNNQN